MTERDIEEFFDKVQEFKKEVNGEERKAICYEGLRPSLRPYQEEAVQWMLKREQILEEEIGECKQVYRVLFCQPALTNGAAVIKPINTICD